MNLLANKIAIIYAVVRALIIGKVEIWILSGVLEISARVGRIEECKIIEYALCGGR
jgi:hypothetical protein